MTERSGAKSAKLRYAAQLVLENFMWTINGSFYPQGLTKKIDAVTELDIVEF